MNNRIVSLGLLSLSLAGLSACTPSVDTQIQSAGQGLSNGSTLIWASLPEGQKLSVTEEQVRGTIVTEMEKQGFHFSDKGGVIVSLGMADRPVGVEVKKADASAMPQIPAPKRLFGGCKRHILHLNISMADAVTGQSLYTGSAQELHCDGSSQTDWFRLVTKALADVDSPSGEVRIERTKL